MSKKYMSGGLGGMDMGGGTRSGSGGKRSGSGSAAGSTRSRTAIRRAKPARKVDINGKRITRKGKLVSNAGARKAKRKGVTTMFTPVRKTATDTMGMSNKLNNKQLRKVSDKMWNTTMAKKPGSFKQARKAQEKDRVRYNTAEKKVNKTEKTLGSPVMWNFKTTLYKNGKLEKAPTRTFPKKSAPVKPSSGRMNKKGKK